MAYNSEKLKKERFNIIIFFVAAILSAVCCFCHESFRDDSQAWLIARDLSLAGLFEELPYEGHPAVWYLIIMPFAKLGFPFYTVKIIAYIFSIAALAVFLFKSPFNKIIKIIIAFSPFMIYYFPSYGRPYSLMTLLIFFLAYLYRYRKKKPILYNFIILVLFNVHTYASVFCSALLILQGIDIIIDFKKKKNISKRRFIGIIIGFIGGLLLVWQLHDCFEMNGDVERVLKNPDYSEYYLQPYFDNLQFLAAWAVWDTPNLAVQFVFAHIAIIVTIILTVTTVKYPKQFIVFTLSFYFLLYMSMFYYIMSAGTKFSIFYVFLIFVCQTMCYEKEWHKKRLKKFEETGNKLKDFFKKDIVIRPLTFFAWMMSIIILIGYPQNYKNTIEDILKLHSDAENTAEFITQNIPKGSTVLCMTRKFTPVCVNTGKGDYIFWDYCIDKPQTFVHLTEDSVRKFTISTKEKEMYLMQLKIKEYYEVDIEPVTSFESTLEYMREYFEKGEKIYILDTSDFAPFYDNCIDSEKYLKKLFCTKEKPITDEGYVIYETVVQ